MTPDIFGKSRLKAGATKNAVEICKEVFHYRLVGGIHDAPQGIMGLSDLTLLHKYIDEINSQSYTGAFGCKVANQ